MIMLRFASLSAFFLATLLAALQTDATKRSQGLTISDLGKVGAGLSARDEQEGTEAK
jgi:hypothetical protein